MKRLLAALLLFPFFALADEFDAATYIGSASCESCHKEATKKWKNSHHTWAWKKPSKQSVHADFQGRSLTTRAVTTRLSEKEGKYFFHTDGPEGEASYEVKDVIGVSPLQQFTLEIEPGKLQAHDVVWDREKKEWYHLYPEQSLKAGDGLHWTGHYKNFNARCAVCHATNFQTNYDVKNDQYRSTQSEIGVGCEACHGPGSKHLTWAKEEKSSEKSADPLKGFTFNFSDKDSELEIQTCAPCHSRREPFTDKTSPPGEPFSEYYRLSLLRGGLYYPDGQIQDEVYVYGSFLQSKMYEKGVRCSDCHLSHSGSLKAEGNAVCTQCHNENGNSKFPTLKKIKYDSPIHHFHKEGSESSQCVNCHMTGRHYMGIDFRRDHSFRIPRPDVSLKIDTPNACTSCHEDKDNAWADKAIKKWYPNGRWKENHFGVLFAKAREQVSPAIQKELLAVAADKKHPDIVRASALSYLLNSPEGAIVAKHTEKFLGDPSALVRSEAAFIQHLAPIQKRMKLLLPLTNDPMRLVRIAVARALIATPTESLSPKEQKSLSAVMKEYQDTIRAKADYPESHVVMAGIAMATKNFKAAEAAFREAVRRDPQLITAWVTLIRIQMALGDMPNAWRALKQALKKNPKQQSLIDLEQQILSTRGGA